jgi:hypothetical protein
MNILTRLKSSSAIITKNHDADKRADGQLDFSAKDIRKALIENLPGAASDLIN